MYKNIEEAAELRDTFKAIWGDSAKQFMLEREESARVEALEMAIPESVTDVNERKTRALCDRMRQLVCLFTLQSDEKSVTTSFVHGGELYKNVIMRSHENIALLRYQMALSTHEQIKELFGMRHKVA